MSVSGTITVLVDNTVIRSGLMGEHGLALWLDLGNTCVLFDTGQTGLLVRNAAELGLGLDAVDMIVLSHGHYDHTGGLAHVLRMVEAPVVLAYHPDALLDRRHRDRRGTRTIGMPGDSRRALEGGNVRPRVVTGPVAFGGGVNLTGEIPRLHPQEVVDEGFRLANEAQEADPFRDDQALWLETGEGPVVLLGCAHAGVINTLDYVLKMSGARRIAGLIGGLHLNAAADARIEWTMEQLQRFDIGRIFPMHCTGTRAVAALWSAFPGRCLPVGAGTTLEL